MTDESILPHALAAAGRGHKVFPLPAGAKKPPPKDWQRIATNVPAAVEAMFRDRPHANYGVLTGEGFVVIDVDPKRGGAHTLRRLQQEHGELPPTFTVVTPSGGLHLYFATGDALANSVDRIGPGVDVRGRGGYVVGPGSRIGDKHYTIDPWAAE